MLSPEDGGVTCSQWVCVSSLLWGKGERAAYSRREEAYTARPDRSRTDELPGLFAAAAPAAACEDGARTCRPRLGLGGCCRAGAGAAAGAAAPPPPPPPLRAAGTGTYSPAPLRCVSSGFANLAPAAAGCAGAEDSSRRLGPGAVSGVGDGDRSAARAAGPREGRRDMPTEDAATGSDAAGAGAPLGCIAVAATGESSRGDDVARSTRAAARVGALSAPPADGPRDRAGLPTVLTGSLADDASAAGSTCTAVADAAEGRPVV